MLAHLMATRSTYTLEAPSMLYSGSRREEKNASSPLLAKQISPLRSSPKMAIDSSSTRTIDAVTRLCYYQGASPDTVRPFARDSLINNSSFFSLSVAPIRSPGR